MPKLIAWGELQLECQATSSFSHRADGETNCDVSCVIPTQLDIGMSSYIDESQQSLS